MCWATKPQIPPEYSQSQGDTQHQRAPQIPCKGKGKHITKVTEPPQFSFLGNHRDPWPSPKVPLSTSHCFTVFLFSTLHHDLQ